MCRRLCGVASVSLAGTALRMKPLEPPGPIGAQDEKDHDALLEATGRILIETANLMHGEKSRTGVLRQHADTAQGRPQCPMARAGFEKMFQDIVFMSNPNLMIPSKVSTKLNSIHYSYLSWTISLCACRKPYRQLFPNMPSELAAMVQHPQH